MNPLLMMNSVAYNPIGMTTRAICEWYWQGRRVQDTRKDNLNLATYN